MEIELAFNDVIARLVSHVIMGTLPSFYMMITNKLQINNAVQLSINTFFSNQLIKFKSKLLIW